MKIILENEMERKAWDILLEAHHKWEKNHYKEETDQMIAKEAGKRLSEDYGPDGLDVMGVSEAMYVSRLSSELMSQGISYKFIIKKTKSLSNSVRVQYR
ncbi:hypothetical protein [Desulforamulus ruminis]|uniref:Uncharacterized protein n=1 Tax=Desulforamulus ruminis (strain ATCC 23193 / DSM 2154 / NCIMB 8452 / DL) TaxID=696281 RepID=F6DTY1_DESRL|nr:hypothetical protein [Desulforamulus ruminis]AEG58999.1 hypothetical protein Desru_0716 [Desulforamulus ruminis DSM 2154]